jgi:hypothetical protein
MDWDAVLRKDVKPRYIPSIRGSDDISNFDKVFTQEAPGVSVASQRPSVAKLDRDHGGKQSSKVLGFLRRLSGKPGDLLETPQLDDTPFRAFSYTAPDSWYCVILPFTPLFLRATCVIAWFVALNKRFWQLAYLHNISVFWYLVKPVQSLAAECPRITLSHFTAFPPGGDEATKQSLQYENRENESTPWSWSVAIIYLLSTL